MTPDLERDGYTVLLGTVPQDAIRAALRCIGLGIRRHGLPGGAERARCQGGTFLPELRDEPAIWALFTGGRWPLGACGGYDDLAEPQLLLRFPDEGCPGVGCANDPQDHPLVPHVDEEPAWAGHEFEESHDGEHARPWCGAVVPDNPFEGHFCGRRPEDPIHVRRRYKAIVGVALTDHGADDGALHVWPGSHIGAQEHLTTWTARPVPVPLRAGDAVVLHPKLAHAGSLNLGHTWQARVYFRLLGAPE